MLNGIDHLVIVVGDLDAAIRNYGELGFAVTPGGKHPIGTHNALIPFADGAYIELIAFTVPHSPHPWNALLAKGDGLIDFCAYTDDFAGALEAFRKAGAIMSEPAPLSRQRPDGYVLKWLLSLPQPPWNGVVPFLIQDETPREERVPRNINHPNGATGVGELTIAVEELAPLRRFYQEMLGQQGEPFTAPELEGTGVSFRLGPQRCTLVAPAQAGGPLAQWLAARGPSPYSAELRGSGRRRVLEVAKTQNARLTLD